MMSAALTLKIKIGGMGDFTFHFLCRCIFTTHF